MDQRQGNRSGHRSGGGTGRGRRRTARPGTALTEAVLMAGLFVHLIYGGLLFHQIIDARQQIATLARETARVMAEAPSAETAVAAGRSRAGAVLVGRSLHPQRL